MKNFIFYIICFSSICLLSSCSVFMASKHEGTSVSKLQKCKTRSQLIAEGGKIINRQYMPNGDLIETYRLKKEKGSFARAFMHGLLDVSTLGVWEVIGTPIEGIGNKDEFFCVTVTFDPSHTIKHVCLH